MNVTYFSGHFMCPFRSKATISGVTCEICSHYNLYLMTKKRQASNNSAKLVLSENSNSNSKLVSKEAEAKKVARKRTSAKKSVSGQNNDKAPEDNSSGKQTVSSMRSDHTDSPKSVGSNSRRYWVGIGASAGGLEALRELVKNLPKRVGNVTYIVAQHLSPKHQSMMVQLLGRETNMLVKEAEHNVSPEAGVIYITPPNSDLYVKDGKLQLRTPPSQHSPKPSVDFFFTTLAEELGDHAIGVILSGTGSDGSHGVRAIRAGGGLTIAQIPKTAKYDGMPYNAVETGCIDITLPPEDIGPEIASLIRSPHNLHLMQETEEKRTAMQELMHLLKTRTSVDFRDYKTGTMFRRLNRRMTACGVLDIDAYLEYISNQPGELDILFRDMMITVTQFFRDTEAFEGLQIQIAELLNTKKEEGTIRVWVPGCATGEEAYSIVILFAEAAGGLSKLQQTYNFQLFATDIDMEALTLARKGVYAETTLESMEEHLKERYFRHRENSYEIIKNVRDMVVFSKHNVFDDPPFLRLDLITCRNLLIYFNNKLQQTVMSLFHYSLNPAGILFLGKSEALGDSTNLFHSTNKQAKLFKRKLISPAERPRSIKVSYSSVPKLETTTSPKSTKTSHEFPDAIIGALSPDSLLIDEDMDVLRIYGDVQAYTQLSAGDASTNLASLVRKEFRQELRALVYKVLRENAEQSVLPKKLNINGTVHKINIIIRPLNLKKSPERLLLISFEKVQRISERAETKSTGTDPIISELEQELSATREHLQTVVEELETSNEELQSTNEEMQSTNEELQSSNEELETTNEELQSTNEELLTVNDELQIKTSELTNANEDLENIKESIKLPLLVVNKELVVTRYNELADEIFMLGEASEGEALTSIATRIDIPELRRNVLGVINRGESFTRQLDDGDRSYLERILPYQDHTNTVKGAVLTYLDNTSEQRVLKQLQESEERYDLAVQGSNAGIWDWQISTDEMHWSPLFLQMLEIRDKNFKGSMNVFEKRLHQDDRQDVMDILQAHLSRGFDFNVEFRMLKEDGSYLWLHARGQASWNHAKKPIRMTGSVYDITDRRQALDHLSKSNESLERFAYVCSHDLKEPARLIENFVHLLSTEYADRFDETAQEYMAFIEDSTARMQEMIKGIFSYSQLESKNLSLDQLDLAAELPNILDNLKLSICETGAKITYDQLPTINADKMQIFQVLQNLIGNSLKFCKNDKPVIHVGFNESGSEWTFSVKDNGIGIKQEHANKIFNIFQRLNNREDFDGSGIGLSICQKSVSNHGGRIWVESELGKGATFFFSLPKKQQHGAIDYG